MLFTIIIPAYNEANAIGNVLTSLQQHIQETEIIVVDDNSTDTTVETASTFSGVKVIQQPVNQGPIKAIAAGMEAASFDVIVTIDADGQHPVQSIQEIAEPVLTDKADLVLGVRDKLPRIGERIIAAVAGVSDATTGLKAMRKDMAESMHKDFVYGGVLVVKAKREKLRIVEVPITVKERISGSSVHSNLNILKKSLQFAVWRVTGK